MHFDYFYGTNFLVDKSIVTIDVEYISEKRKSFLRFTFSDGTKVIKDCEGMGAHRTSEDHHFFIPLNLTNLKITFETKSYIPIDDFGCGFTISEEKNTFTINLDIENSFNYFFDRKGSFGYNDDFDENGFCENYYHDKILELLEGMDNEEIKSWLKKNSVKTYSESFWDYKEFMNPKIETG